MAKAPVVTELPLQNVRFLFGTMVDLRMLPQVLEQTGNAEVGEFKLVAHFPADEKAANNEAGYLARHKGFRGGDYNTYHGDPYTLDEVIWDATGRAGVHLVTKTKYGAVVEFPTIPDKNDSAELMLIVSEYVESIKTPPLIVRCSGFGGSISPLGNKKYQLNLTTGATKCPTSIKDHVPKKYHAEDNEIIPHVGGAYIMNAEDLSPAEQSLISNTIVNQMQGYYRTGVIGTDPVIGAFPNGPMSISKRTPEAKQDFFREPAVQDEDGFWNKGPNRWQAHKIARGVAYNKLEKAREMGALTPGYRHRGSSGKFRRNPFRLGAEDYAAESLLLCSEHDDYFNACGCGSKNAESKRLAFGFAECGKCGDQELGIEHLCPDCDLCMADVYEDGTPLGHACCTCTPQKKVLNEQDGMGGWREVKGAEEIPVWNDGIVEWETSGPMSPTGSGYSSASVPPTGVMAGPGDTFLNYTDAQNYLVESSGGLWGAEDDEGRHTCDHCGKLADFNFQDIDVRWDLEDGEFTGSYDLRAHLEGYNDFYCISCVGKHGYAAEEEGNTPVMPPHEFGQPVHWQPYDERITALKRQRAEGGRPYIGQPSLKTQARNIARREGKTAYGVFVKSNGKPIMFVSQESISSSSEKEAIDDGLTYFRQKYPGVKFIKFDSEEFAAMARIDPKNATDVKNVVSALKKRYNKIKISRTEYITNRKGSSNKYHVFAFTNRGVFNGYGRIGKTMTIFGPMSESQGHSKLDRKLRQGYKETV